MKKTPINSIYPNLWAPTAVHYRVWLSCSSVSTTWSLGMFVKSRSNRYSLDWSGVEHYRQCCQ